MRYYMEHVAPVVLASNRRRVGKIMDKWTNTQVGTIEHVMAYGGTDRWFRCDVVTEKVHEYKPGKLPTYQHEDPFHCFFEFCKRL